MGIRLIISDVDETLISNDSKLMDSAYAKELLALIESKRIPLTIASGRSYENVLRATRGLKLSLPVIVGNGIAVVCDGEIRWAKQFPVAGIREVIEQADRMGMTVVLSDGLYDTVYRMTEWAAARMQRSGHRYVEYRRERDFWEKAVIGKVMIVDPQTQGRILRLRDSCEFARLGLAALQYGSHYMDIMPAVCSKGEALVHIAEQLKLDLSECLAIGDNANDIEMIRNAGIGAAVANATDELKQAADYICRKPSIEGVIECIRKFVI